jgi:putative Holliday junction resolvase
MNKGRIAAIDYGRARIGLAMTDPGQILASPLATVSGRLGPKVVIEALSKHELIEIVVGMPLLLNGTKGEMALEVDAFIEKLKELTDLPITTWDERLTSAQAERHLKAVGLNRKQRASLSDEAAAVTILQSYLDSPRG